MLKTLAGQTYSCTNDALEYASLAWSGRQHIAAAVLQQLPPVNGSIHVEIDGLCAGRQLKDYGAFGFRRARLAVYNAL